MAQPSPQQVGREFVRQYYTVLHEAPEVLHRFYSSGSTFVHGGVDQPGRVEEPVVGQLEIDKKIRSLAFKDCHTKIRQVDAQATIGSGVVVQVTGELSNNGEPMRRFMQTFVLAPQTPKKFYVHNDIFRYQDEVYQDLSDTESEEVQHVQQVASQQQPTNASIQQPASQQASGSSSVELKSTNYYPNQEASDNQHSELDHQHHHEQANASSASSTSSQALSSASSASATAPVSTPEHHNHESSHDQSEKSQQPLQQQSQQPQAPQPIQQEERKKVANESSGSKENGPSDVKSSWAHIITHKTDGVPVSTATMATAPPTAQTNSAYSTNSLPRGANKENRYNKQNGYNNNTTTTTNNNSGQLKQQSNAGQSPSANSKPRNNNSFSNNNNSNNNTNFQQSVTPTGVAPVSSNTSSAAPNMATGRQNGGGLGGETNQMDDGEDKRFGSNRYPDSHQVFVGNLSQDLSDAELKAFFSQYGRVVEVRINSNTKQMSGRRLPNYGFVVFEDGHAVENLLSSTKSNNLTLKNERGEFRLNIEEKRARQGRQSSGYGGGNGGGKQRPNRSTSNGSGGAGGSNHVNGKKPQYRGDNANEEGGNKRGGGVTTAVYQRRS